MILTSRMLNVHALCYQPVQTLIRWLRYIDRAESTLVTYVIRLFSVVWRSLLVRTDILTLKVLISSTADDILIFFLIFFFRENVA